MQEMSKKCSVSLKSMVAHGVQDLRTVESVAGCGLQGNVEETEL